MADPNHPPGDPHLNERILDLFVFVPAGLAVAVVEEFPRLAERGREKLGVRVSSARAVGQFAMRAGQDEFRRRSGALLGRAGAQRTAPARPRPAGPTSGATGDGVTSAPSASAPSTSAPGRATDAGRPVHAVPTGGNGHVPPVSTLSIPDFDTLSASQVVQRLDGLNRAELVSVRAYEASNRGRRTILSRVDQLLDERS